MISVEDAMQQIKRGADEILLESELQEKLKCFLFAILITNLS